MRVLITGAKGQLGLELQRQLRYVAEIEHVISTTHDTLDITSLDQVREKLKRDNIDIVINCAAYTFVDECEKNREKAYLVNAIGPKNLATVCQELGLKLIHLSTDYVFDGSGQLPKKEDDKVMPINIYGKSKLLGEEYVRSFCTKYFIIRTSWLYGEGNNFVRTMLKLAQDNKELNVVGDQFGTPTSTKDLAHVIINLMQTEYYGIFHGTCEGECSWYELACKIFELKGIDVKINKVTSEEFIRPAQRPKYSVLDNFRLKNYGMNEFRHWEEALVDYLKEN